MSLKELKNKIKKLENKIKELEKENKELKDENKELKDKNKELNLNCFIAGYIDIHDINNGILKQYICEADGYHEFIEEYITTKYSKNFYNFYNNYRGDDILDEINFDTIFNDFKNDDTDTENDDIDTKNNTENDIEIDFSNITYFLRALLQQNYKEAREYALDFLKDNIDNFKEIKEYLDELYEEFINNEDD